MKNAIMNRNSVQYKAAILKLETIHFIQSGRGRQFVNQYTRDLQMATRAMHMRINGKGARELDMAEGWHFLPEYGKKNTRNHKGFIKNFDRNLRRGKFEV